MVQGGNMMLFIFFREHDGKGFFYPLELASPAEARANAECNPGTIRVETVGGDVVWRAPELTVH